MARLTPALARGDPQIGIAHAAPNPHHREGGQDAEEEHIPPRVRPQRRDEEPYAGRKQESKADGRLEHAGGAAPRPRRPGLTQDRGARSPLGAQAEARQEAQDQEARVAPGERREPREQCVPENRQHQHTLASDVVREDAGDDSAGRPPDEGHGQEKEELQP